MIDFGDVFGRSECDGAALPFAPFKVDLSGVRIDTCAVGTPDAEREAARLGKSKEISVPGIRIASSDDDDTLVRFGLETWVIPAAAMDEIRRHSAYRSRSGVRSVSYCGIRRAAGETIEVQRRDTEHGGRGRMTGTKPCKLACCPHCAPKLRRRISLELQETLKQLLSGGRDCYMLTLTLRHQRGESLANVRKRLDDAWHSLWKGRYGEALRATGIHWIYKAVEVTYGRNGWHPHIHVILSVDNSLEGPLGAAFASAQRLAQMRDKWAEACEPESTRRRSYVREHGFELKRVRSNTAQEVADYMAGMDTDPDATGAAMETARGDLKRSHKGNVSVWELPLLMVQASREGSAMVGDVSHSHAVIVKRWQEFELVMSSTHQTAFSQYARDWRPTSAELDAAAKELLAKLAKKQESQVWETVYEPTPADMALVRLYGKRQVLEAAAWFGTAGVERVFEQYRQRAQLAGIDVCPIQPCEELMLSMAALGVELDK